MSDRLHEDAVRLVRQRLLALEEGREKDAETLARFLGEEFSLTLVDTTVADAEKAYPDIVVGWRRVYGLPDTVQVVSLLMEYAKEPVWRVPRSSEDRGVSWYEVPLHLQRAVPFAPAEEDEAKPEQLRRRTAGDLPRRITRAIRIPDQAPPDDEENDA